MLASVVLATFFLMHVRVPPVGLQTLNVIDFFMHVLRYLLC